MLVNLPSPRSQSTIEWMRSSGQESSGAQSLLKGLPIGAQSNEYADTSALSDFLGSAGGILGLLQALNIVQTPEQEFTPITINTGTPTSTNTGSV